MRNLVPSRWGLCLPAQPPRAPPGYRAQTREEPSGAPKGLPGHRRDQGPAQPNFTRVKSPSSPCLGHPPPLSQTPTLISATVISFARRRRHWLREEGEALPRGPCQLPGLPGSELWGYCLGAHTCVPHILAQIQSPHLIV